MWPPMSSNTSIYVKSNVLYKQNLRGYYVRMHLINHCYVIFLDKFLKYL